MPVIPGLVPGAVRTVSEGHSVILCVDESPACGLWRHFRGPFHRLV